MCVSHFYDYSDFLFSHTPDPTHIIAYKTMMCFVTSWLVLAFGEKLTFTPWGIVSACFWVPSGVAAIAGIKLAGLAVAMGTLSSFIVLVSFVWGIFVFDETIHSREIACLAVCLMMMGLCGMGYYSSLEHDDDSELVLLDGENYRLMDDAEDNEEATGVSVRSCSSSVEHGVHATTVNDICLDESSESGEASTDQPLSNIAVGPPENSLPPRIVSPLHNNSRDKIIIWGRPWARRQVGIACSVFCGVWGGSIMAPEKLAKADASGVGYLISFGIGAVIVTTALWMARFSYHWARFGSVSSAYQALPSFHFRVMWLPGCTAGTLWSIGNFFSLISVKYLGEGVGYSVTQSAMLGNSIDCFYYKLNALAPSSF